MRRAVILGVALLHGLSFLSSFAVAAPPREGWSKALVWPAKPGDRLSAATLTSLGAERIRDYEAFSLVLVPTASAVDAASTAAERGLRLDIEDDWDRLLMPGATVDTRDPVLPSGGLIDGYPAGEGLFVVQFDGPDTTALLDDLASRGLTYVEDVPYNGVVVLGRASDIAKLSASPGVQWASVYHPAFRNQPKALAPEGEVRKILVQLVNTPHNQGTLERLRAATLAP
jgi:hypothetical protein